MWRHEQRSDRSWMDAHLASRFVEFGRSGRRYSRSEIIDMHVEHFEAVLPLPELAIRWLGDHVALMTYQSEIGGQRANRSSIWRHRDARWLLEFHQGTPTSDGTS